MAEARRNWRFLLAALALGGCAAAAQPGPDEARPPHAIQVSSSRTGAIAGRLTNLHSAPLGGISVMLRNLSTGSEAHAITQKNGAFSFASLEAGTYTLEADAGQLGRGRLEGILVTGGAEARLQFAIDLEPGTRAQIEAEAPLRMPASATAMIEGSPPPQISPAAQPATAPPASSAAMQAARSPRATEQSSAPTQGPPVSASSAELALVIPQQSPHGRPLAGAESRAAMHAPAQPATVPLLPVIEAPRLPVISPFGPREQAALETQSVPIQPALAITLPRTLPLDSRLASDLAPIASAVRQPDPAAPAVANQITAEQLQALPASGRHWQDFLLDTPAASAASDSSQPSFRGTADFAEITIDGANTRSAFASAGASSHASSQEGENAGGQNPIGQAWSARRGLGVSESAVRAVTTVAGNVEAEGMRSAGGRTSIETESGENALHGQGFFFDRQNTWGARNPFTQWVQNTGTAVTPNFSAAPYTPPDHEEVMGLGMGSRIKRDKLFWFAALDSSHRNDPGLATAKDPAEFFNLPEPTSAPVTLLSAQLGESQNQAYSDYLGVAGSGYTAAGLEQLAVLLGPAQRTSAQWVGFARIDWQATERQRFTLEGTGADWNSDGGGITRVSATYGSHSFGSGKAQEEWLLGRWEAYLTPNLLAVTQGSAGRAVMSDRPSAPSTFEQSFLRGNIWGQLPQIVVDSRYGFTIGNPSRFGQGSYPDERVYHGQQMLDWAHNRLLVKAGFELDHDADATSLLRNQTGTYHYANVASFISDALAFEKFGMADALDQGNPHNCGTTDTKFGSQPCYSYFSQTMGPASWHLSTNDWAGYVTAQWQPALLAVFSAGLRWEREQMPPAMALLANSELPLTQMVPSPGNNWGPRASLALGSAKSRWPVFRLGYGMYYGRTENATVETALTQTGSLKGDLSFFMRPSDDCQFCSGGAPPFPYVFAGEPASVVKPGAVEFAHNFRNPEIHQAVASIEETLPGRVEVTGSAMLSLGRRLPVAVDTNFDQAVNPGTITYSVKDPTGKGPIKTTQITVPFYASWPSASSPSGVAGRLNPDYQQISEIMSRANSTYEAAMVRITRNSRRGLSLHAHYTYAHAMDWNPNETTLVAGSDMLDPAHFSQEYGTSNLDVRHSAAVMAILTAPWKMRGFAGQVANGWMLSGIGQFRSGLPYTMRTSGSLPEEFTTTGSVIAGLGPGMNGSGGDNRVYGVGRNTFRYPDTWKADLRLAKRFDLGEMRELELLAESFNLFNHQNVTEIETTGYAIENSGSSGTLPTLCYLTINTIGYASCGTTTTTGTGTPLPAFGQPLNINGTDFYRERQIELGVRMRF
jgi:hypothetical protein